MRKDVFPVTTPPDIEPAFKSIEVNPSTIEPDASAPTPVTLG